MKAKEEEESKTPWLRYPFERRGRKRLATTKVCNHGTPANFMRMYIGLGITESTMSNMLLCRRLLFLKSSSPIPRLHLLLILVANMLLKSMLRKQPVHVVFFNFTS